MEFQPLTCLRIYPARHSFLAETLEEVVLWGDLEMGSEDYSRLRGVRRVVANHCQVAVVCAAGLVLLPEHEWHELLNCLGLRSPWREVGGAALPHGQRLLGPARRPRGVLGRRPGGGGLGGGAGDDLRRLRGAGCGWQGARLGRSAARRGRLRGAGEAWGRQRGACEEQLWGIVQVAGSFAAFAALREDGEIITWGSPGAGGDLTQGA